MKDKKTPVRQLRTENSEFFRSALVQAFLVGTSALFVIVTGRYWGASARGDLSLVQVAGGLVASLGGLGLVDVLVYAEGRHDRQERLGWCLSSLAVVALVGLVAAGAVRVAGVAVSLCAAIPATAVLLQMNRISATMRLASGKLPTFDLLRSASVVVPCITAVVIALALGATAVSIVSLYLVALSVAAVPLFVRDVGLPPGTWRPAVLPGDLRPLARQSVLWSFVQLGLARFDVIIVYLISGPLEAGVYGSAIAVAEAASFASVAMAYHAQRRGAAGEVQRRRIDILVTCVVLVVGMVSLPVLTPPLLGADFAAMPLLFVFYAPAVLALALLRPSLAFRFGANAATGSMPVLLGGLVASVLANLVVVPLHGAEGAAVVSSVGYLGSYLLLRRRWTGRP